MRELKSALVLGGAGFLGSWIVRALKAQRVATIVVDDLSTGDGSNLDPKDLVVSDVRSADLNRIMRERAVDVVFHLASRAYVPPSFDQPLEDLERNAGTTLMVLEAARRLRPSPLVVCASSAAVYGEGTRMPMAEDHPIKPLSPYGISKYAAEEYVRLYAELYGVPAISLRLFSVYGPGQRKQVVYDLLCRALAGQAPLTVLGLPDVSRDLVFVVDAARAFLDLAVRAPARGEAYNVASGSPTTLAALVETVLQVLDVELSVRFTGAVRPGDPRRWQGDPGRAGRLGVECRTPLADGIRRTAQWVKASAGGELAPVPVRPAGVVGERA